MNINVSRRYRGKKDTKGNIVSDYSYRNSGSTVNNNILKSASVEEETYNDPLRTTLTDFVLCLNFKELIPFEYVCPDDMLISEQIYETDIATLFIGITEYTLEDFLPQFTKITITPSDLGVVLLIGKMKSSFVKTFTNYIEVNTNSTQVQTDWNQTNNTEPDYIKHKPTVIQFTYFT